MSAPKPPPAAVLVVIGDHSTRYRIAEELRSAGYAAPEAGDGAEALYLVNRHSIDAVVLDDELPKTTSRELLAEIRKIHPAAKLPIILLTENTGPGESRAALEKGADDCLPKPVDRSLLLARLRSHIALKRSEQTREGLKRIVIHEMRNPLTNLLSSLTFVRDEFLKELPDDVREMLLTAVQNSGRLDRLIKNVADWERLMEGTLELELVPVDLRSTVAKAFEEISVYCSDHDVAVRSSVPEARVLAHPDALMRILTNLVSNAVKHTRKGGEVSVAAAIVARNATPLEKVRLVRGKAGTSGEERSDAGEIIIAVIDEGRGIPLREQERIFDPFVIIENGETGVGLGLPISRALVELHGGRLWFMSEPGLGTTFLFPLKSAP